MSWHAAVQDALKTLDSAVIPSSLELISLIKKVNPTTVCLSETQRLKGYEIKSRLQNLLLEHYGETFRLVPHPLNSEIVLIKHAALPSIDACHTPLAALSRKALDQALSEAEPVAQVAPKKARKANKEAPEPAGTPRELLRRAQEFLAGYDFAAAEEVLCSIRITDRDDVPTVERAVRALIEEMGGYQQAVDLVLAQQHQFLRDPRLRVLSARAYHLCGAFAEARAIFDGLQRKELDKEALVAYADIAHKDGNLALALKLLQTAEETEGFAGGLEGLKQEVEAALQVQVAPLLDAACAALQGADLAGAEALAREVLHLFPGNPRAREVVAAISADREAAEIALLWERLAQTAGCEARLELLEKLLARDRANEVPLAALVAQERGKQKKAWAQTRLERLRVLVVEGCWPEAFDIVWWLNEQAELREDCREACSLSPYLAFLLGNRRLERLPDKSARQAWLDLVAALGSCQAGEPAGCLDILERVRHYFEKYREFQEVYDAALVWEQGRAREEIEGILAAAGREGTTLGQVQAFSNTARKAMLHLPLEERAEIGRKLEARIAELTPTHSDEDVFEAYRYFVRSGVHDRADLVRNMLPGRDEDFKRCAAEVAADLAIERTPLRLEFSGTLPPDLFGEAPLQWIGSTDRHIVWQDGEDALVVLDVNKRQAGRFVSPHLKGVYLLDALPADDTFLFSSTEDPLHKWRAVLNDEECVFTACVDIREFSQTGDDVPVSVYFSSERASDYYVVIWDAKETQPGRVVRRKIGNKCQAVNLQVGSRLRPEVLRISSYPDKFIIGCDDIMKFCFKNLTSDYSLDMPPRDVWEIDAANGHFYYFDRAILKRANIADYENRITYSNSSCCFFFAENHRKLGLSPETGTLMVRLRQKAALYHYGENRISQSFALGRLVGTKPARSWYVYDYQKESQTLTVRDIGRELADLLEWEEAQTPVNGKEKENPNWSEELHRQIYFGYTAEEDEPSAAEGEPAGS
ncbi:hypothetical protein GMST_24380 [Geomonas silvestris]|uniref:Uncharacterized protein n=1 Tax=Geomonas silvestris TaxID=2740184 RepID=A0A6V8MK40_9BACT|nr:hypothetical protein [Geomonas silvestris]GFO60113.1 hypothetical protein GMST_24380 [Geomonas silvestris]